MSLITAVRTVAATTAVAALAALGVATDANAAQYTSLRLTPGQQACVTQYASYQVRADGLATNAGAKFKLQRNGVVVANSVGLATGFAAELRSIWGIFPGPGYYTLCATNNGTTNTVVTITLRTDGEI